MLYRWYDVPGGIGATGASRYELFIDDLPVWGFVGPPPEETKDDENIYLYTHKAFEIAYNGNRVGGKWLQPRESPRLPATARLLTLPAHPACADWPGCSRQHASAGGDRGAAAGSLDTGRCFCMQRASINRSVVVSFLLDCNRA